MYTSFGQTFILRVRDRLITSLPGQEVGLLSGDVNRVTESPRRDRRVPPQTSRFPYTRGLQTQGEGKLRGFKTRVYRDPEKVSDEHTEEIQVGRLPSVTTSTRVGFLPVPGRQTPVDKPLR